MTSWKEIRMDELRTKTNFKLLLIGIYCVNCVLTYLFLFESWGIGFNIDTLLFLLFGALLIYPECYVLLWILDFLGNPMAPYALYSLSFLSSGGELDPEKVELLAKKYNERRIGKYADWGKWDYTATPEEINAYKLRKQKNIEREQIRELKIQADNEQVRRMMRSFGRAYLIIFFVFALLFIIGIALEKL